MKKVKNILRNEKGLTLIELLAVVVILGIIAAIAIPAIAGLIGNTKKDAHVASAEQILNAARLALTQEAIYDDGTTKVKYEDLGTENVKDTLVADGYLETLQDPDSKGEYVKAEITITGGLVTDITLEGAEYTLEISDSTNGIKAGTITKEAVSKNQ